MNTAVTMPATRLWGAYLGEIRYEFIKSLRTPGFAVPTLFFPIMFYVLFGIFLGSMRGNSGQAQYMFATYGVFGAMGPGLFGFGVSLAIEREQGLLTLKQALPQPPGAYLLARAAMAMLFVGLISLMLTITAVTVGKVPLTLLQGLQIFVINALGALPFCAIGLFVGSWVSGQASPAIVNLIFLPMAFLSGLWLPLSLMPKFLQDLAPLWPAYHLAQIALEAVGAESQGNFWTHLSVLMGVTVAFLLLAVRRMHGGGFRLLGSSPKRSLLILAAVAVLAIALAGVWGGKASRDGAADAATDATPGSALTSAPSSPAGIAAPDVPQIAGFDSGSATTAYGIGFSADGDANRGGNSTATQRIVEGGAGGSAGALEISGSVGGALPYPFAGSAFFPQGPAMEGLSDFSRKQMLRFQARGDGRRYTVLIMSGLSTGGIPLMQDFVAGPEWKEVRLTLAEYSNADWQRVRLIAIGSMGPVGEFRFQIDDVRLE
jgi:ABC-2 type transport system permease protein